jgi:hypothetical protein
LFTAFFKISEVLKQDDNFMLTLIFQSCRVNLKLDSIVCDAMMAKSTYNIICEGDEEAVVDDSTETSTLLPAFMQNYTVNGTNVEFSEFRNIVCESETNSQKLMASYNGVRGILCEYIHTIRLFWTQIDLLCPIHPFSLILHHDHHRVRRRLE